METYSNHCINTTALTINFRKKRTLRAIFRAMRNMQNNSNVKRYIMRNINRQMFVGFTLECRRGYSAIEY